MQVDWRECCVAQDDRKHKPTVRRWSVKAASFVAGSRMVDCASRSREPVRDALFLRLNQAAALLLLLMLSPLLLLVTFLIWRRDGAPVLFAHYRVGHNGKLFRCMKFRTMLRNSEQVL